jgi:hypothetical protein
MRCGGFGKEKEATGEEQDILNSVKGEVEQLEGKVFTHFQALKYTTQVVAGVNYLMKVKADDKILHVKIGKPLPHTNLPPFVMGVKKDGITHESPLEPID